MITFYLIVFPLLPSFFICPFLTQVGLWRGGWGLVSRDHGGTRQPKGVHPDWPKLAPLHHPCGHPGSSRRGHGKRICSDVHDKVQSWWQPLDLMEKQAGQTGESALQGVSHTDEKVKQVFPSNCNLLWPLKPIQMKHPQSLCLLLWTSIALTWLGLIC